MSYKNKVFNKLFTKEVELSKEVIELTLIDDIKKIQGDFEKAGKSASKNVAAALSDLADSTAAIEKGIKITEDAITKAKDLGASDFVKRGQIIKSKFDNSLTAHRKALSDLRNAKGLII